jgi:hypothetical protein
VPAQYTLLDKMGIRPWQLVAVKNSIMLLLISNNELDGELITIP